MTRHLDWDGCFNARDLGGLPAAGGARTRRRAVVRADALDGLSAAGWRSVAEYGVRTIIDLREEDERGPDRARRPAGLETLHLPLDAGEDRDFWRVWGRGPQFGTPLYYALSHERLPARAAAHGLPDEGPQLRAFLDQRGVTPEQAVLDLLGGTDVIGAVRAAGFGDRQLQTLRSRLLG